MPYARGNLQSWPLHGMDADCLGDHHVGKKASDAPRSASKNSAPVAKRVKIGPGQGCFCVYANLSNPRAASARMTQSTHNPEISPFSSTGQTDPPISPPPAATETSTYSVPGPTLASTATFPSTL